MGNQYHQYWKLDVRDGKPKVVWKHDAKVQGGGKSAHSIALLGNNLYYNVGNDNANPRLVALDKNSGEVVFETSTNMPSLAMTRQPAGAVKVAPFAVVHGTSAARCSPACTPPAQVGDEAAKAGNVQADTRMTATPRRADQRTGRGRAGEEARRRAVQRP